MELELLCFGIAKDIVGKSKFRLQCSDACTTEELRQNLLKEYPAFGELVNFSIAVNNEYVRGNMALHPSDEIAIIPPVSGG